MARTLDELTKIANDNWLSLYQTQRFVEFAKLWKNGEEKDTDYLSEWASRFRKNCEYVMADNETRKLLIQVDGKLAPYVCESQYRRIDWCDESVEEQVKGIRVLMKYVIR
jgi:hypothetical protein